MAWGILVQLGIWATLYIANKLLTPKPKEKPLTRENLELPRTEEGSPLPYVFGRTRVQSPILIWNGDLQTKTVDNSNNGAQYNVYAVDMLFCVGIPMGSGVTKGNSLAGPRLHKVWMGDQLMPEPVQGSLPAAGRTQIYYSQMVFQPHAFGGPGAGGGLIGAYTFFGGWTDQNLTSPVSRIGDVMTDKLVLSGQGDAGDIPGFRRQMLLAMHKYPKDSSDPYWNQTGQNGGSGTHEAVPYPEGGFILGESPNIDGISVEVSCYGDGGSGAGGFAMNGANVGVDFGGDADPAEVIYDLLTNTWARGAVSPSKLDTASFSACSDTLKSEEHGVSGVIYDAQDVANTIQALLRQTNAAMYEEPTTGLLTLKLIRFDFNPASVPSFDEDSIIEISDFGVGGFKETINEVRVVYTDRSAEYKPGIAVAQSIANAVGNNNRRRSRTIEYPFCTNAKLAAELAARDLNVLSRPLARIKLTLDRTAHRLRPGSVFKVTYQKYTALAAGMYFRVKSIDHGQLFSNKIVIEAAQDPFTTTYQGLGFDWFPPSRTLPFPLWDRTVTESPRWLAQEAANSGLITDADVPHLLPMPRPSKNATQFTLRSRQKSIQTVVVNNKAVISAGYKISALFMDWQVDVPHQDFPAEFVVATDYARELEPYDTTTGLVIEGLTGIPFRLLGGFYGNLFGSGTDMFVATQSEIENDGKNLICVMVGNEMEFIAFESMTALGSGRYRLNNVWRGLMDTPAIELPAGSRGVFVTPQMISRRGWNGARQIHAWVTPRSTHIVGSGEDPEDTYVGFDQAAGRYGNSYIAARSMLPLSPADVAVGNDGVPTVGTHAASPGTPSVAGYYKALPFLEEGADVAFRLRDRLSTTLVRGDAADQTLNEASPIFRTFTAAKRGEVFPMGTGGGPGQLRVYDGVDSESSPSPRRGFLVDGYGWIDMTLQVSRQVGTNDPLIGKGGIGVNTTQFVWKEPRITAFMPSWRNLLANVRWSYSAVDELSWDSPGVITGKTGTHAIGSGSSFAITRSTASRWLGAASATMQRGQTVFVENWKPRGLIAFATVYIRGQNSDSDDTCMLTLDARDETNVLLASHTLGAFATPTASWSVIQSYLALPAGTANLTVKLTANNAGAGGTANADGAFTEPQLRVGQFVAGPFASPLTGATTLSNHSFQLGTTAGWTVAAGTWSVISTAPGPSGQYVAAIAATCVLYQEYTLPAGAEYGSTAICQFWMRQITTGNLMRVKLEAMDGASTVLAISETGAIDLPSLQHWHRYTLFLAIPDGATKVRVTLEANYVAGTNGTFDEVDLTIVKDLDPRVTRTLDWSAPSKHDMPATWQQFALTLPTAIERYTSFTRGYPRTVDQMNAAVGMGSRWTAGWLFNELSGTIPSEFAQPPSGDVTSYPLTVSGTAPQYGNVGARGAYPDRSVRFVNATDALSGGNNFNPSTGDIMGACTIFIDSITGDNDIMGKGYAGGGGAPGWLLAREADALAFYVSDGVTPIRAGVSPLKVGAWYSVFFKAERAANSVRLAVVELAGSNSNTVLGVGVFGYAALGDVTNGSDFKVGDQGVYGAGNFYISSLYLSAGAGVCGTIGTASAAAVKNFASAVNGSLTVPDYVFGGEDFNGQQVEWTDGAAHESAKVVGQFGGGITSVNGYQFSRASGAAALHAAAKWSTRSTVGNFKLTDPFTAVVFYRVDEPGLSTLAGLFGRMDLTAGWGLYISASGQATALLRGSGATSKSVSTGRVASEGGLRMAALVNDPGTQLLWVYDEFGGVAVSTAFGLGDIDRVAAACHLRIGRDVDDHDVLPGQIARAYVWKDALTGTELRALWNYARDPNSKITTYTRTAHAWALGPDDDEGVTAYTVGADQVAIPYHEQLTADEGTGFGLAIGRSMSNLLPDNTFTSANWVLDGGAGRTTGIIGPTGNPRSVRLTMTNAAGLRCANVPLGATTNVRVTFLARSISGHPDLHTLLYNSADVLKAAVAVTLTTSWKRYDVNLTGWDASTATGKVRWRMTSADGVVEISEVVCVVQGEDIPLLIPYPASTHGDHHAEIDGSLVNDITMPEQFNSEGEVIVQGTSTVNPPAVGTRSIVRLHDAAVSAINRREISTIATPGYRFGHYDGAGAAVSSDVVNANWTRVWRVSGRWNRFKMLDGGVAENAKVAFTDHVLTANQLGGAGRNATFSMTTTKIARIKVGDPAPPQPTLIRQVVVQAREEKYV